MNYKYILAKKLIKHYEGFRPEMYLDAVGVPTIGWGRTTGSMAPTTMAKEDAWLETEMRRINIFINSVVVPKQSSEQMAALISFIYNVGPGAFQKSTLLKTINLGRVNQNELLRWCKAGNKVLPGLVKRRMSEYLLYRTAKLHLIN